VRRQLPLAEALLKSGELVLREFASMVNPKSRIADLRNARSGSGFAWAPAAPDRPLQRYRYERLFAIPPKRGLITRLFGR
jgi:hypothetical protein